ncbi:uncharacterized protein LOC113291079 [Papaver somniferum]|uniref:uncharacterized protein LOC113291079 n=1 Tax=Papaver somniferum TaxID=3469 RepID=UPI000E6F6D16|nr:uncharacterized protein LOC113291079 [Papaver somniferum]
MAKQPSSSEKLVAIGLGLLAVLSPLYIDQKASEEEEEEDVYEFSFAPWLPLLLVVLMVSIYCSRQVDQNFTNFDPYWIHRVGGSSCGIIFLLVVIALVLKFKASLMG